MIVCVQSSEDSIVTACSDQNCGLSALRILFSLQLNGYDAAYNIIDINSGN
ncbi:hypothetical protein MNBD_DELTA03-1008 [hydrothermal vent metagenome]|uniref:Uncharacterized protein n=1 Tax=hydrothermal vent metagenome TaxID=652676 RepID=A0A3B0VYB5_9ZZZZ